MGTSYNVYIGPVVLCKISEKIKTWEIPACINFSCCRRGKETSKASVFCENCGHKIGVVNKSQEFPEHSIVEITEAIDCSLIYVCDYEEQGHNEKLIINDPKKCPTLKYLSADAHHNYSFDISDIDVEEELKKFEDGFSKELALIRSILGVENVQVKYLVIPNIS